MDKIWLYCSLKGHNLDEKDAGDGPWLINDGKSG